MTQKTSLRASRYFSLVGVAAAINVVVFLIGQASGATYDVKAPTPVILVMVIGMTVAQLAVGYLVAWLSAKYAPKFFGPLIWLGLVFAIVSAPGGWILSQDAATGIALGLMHVSGGLAWFFGVKK